MPLDRCWTGTASRMRRFHVTVLRALSDADGPPSAARLLAVCDRDNVSDDALAALVRAAFDLAKHNFSIERPLLVSLETLVDRLGEKGAAFSSDLSELRRRVELQRPQGEAPTSWFSMFARTVELFQLPSRPTFERDALDAAQMAEQLAARLGDGALADAARKVSARVADDGRHVRYLIAGEMKHGKSSLFNGLVGREFSPVGEAFATTSTTLEVSHSDRSTYAVEWFTAAEAQALLQRAREIGAPSAIDYAERMNALVDGGSPDASAALGSLSGLPDFVGADGAFTPAVTCVRITAPVPVLSEGAVLIDTPGLNDAMRLREEATLRAADDADVVVFVMRADRFGTESERRFLKALHDGTQVRRVLIVATHVDRVSERVVASLDERVRSWLLDVCGERVPLFSAAPFFMIDARTLSSARPGEDDVERFRRALGESVPDAGGDPTFREATSRLLGEIAARLDELSTEDEQRAAIVERRLGRAETLAGKAAQARDRADEVEQRVERDRDALNARMDALDAELDQRGHDALQTLRRELTEIVDAEIAELGAGFADQARWQGFLASKARPSATAAIEGLEASVEASIGDMRRAAEAFTEESTELATRSLTQVRAGLVPEEIEALMPNLWVEAFRKRADELATAGRTLAIAGTSSVASLAVSGTTVTRGVTMLGALASAKLLAVGAAATGLGYVGLRGMGSANTRADVRRKIVDAVIVDVEQRLTAIAVEGRSRLDELREMVRSVDAGVHRTAIAQANALADEAELLKSLHERMQRDERAQCEQTRDEVEALRNQLERAMGAMSAA